MGRRTHTAAVIAIGLTLTALLAGGFVPTATGATGTAYTLPGRDSTGACRRLAVFATPEGSWPGVDTLLGRAGVHGGDLARPT